MTGQIRHLIYFMTISHCIGTHAWTNNLSLVRRHYDWRLQPALQTWVCTRSPFVQSSWYVMAHGDAREGKWRGNWRMEWVASTLHITSEHGVSNITTVDAHTLAASSRLNWRPHRFKCTCPFRRKTKSGFCACDITFQTQSTSYALSAQYSRCNFLRDTGGVHRIGYSLHHCLIYLFTYLYLRCKVCSCPVDHIKIIF